MLTTPKDPPGSASSTVSAHSSPVLDEPDPALETTRLRHEVALLAVRQEIEEARAATASATHGRASGEDAVRLAAGAGTVASWVAHGQLGVALETIGKEVARALGVVPKAERVAMSEAVTEALVKAARDHLDRAAVAEISGVHRSALEQACMAALDRQAQLSIDEARRRNSLEDESAADAPPLTAVQGEDVSTSRPIRVLVTDDALVTSSDWRAHHVAAQITAHVTALQQLSAQTTAASKDLEATLDCWVRGARPGETTQPPAAAEPPPNEQWLAQAGIADAAAAIAGGVKILAGAGVGQGGGAGTNGAGSATAPGHVNALSLQLLELASSDLTVSHRRVSVGTHELVMRGAGALATNLGPQGTAFADGLTTLNPSDSPLMTALDDLLQQRNDLASSVAGLAGTVSFARSLAGLDDRPTLAPGLRELARQALLHERLVAHVVESLGAIDRDVRAWVHTGDDGEAPPLLAAFRRERLHAGTERFTHVLVLQDEGLTADVITRRSIMGDSSRLTHVGSASVSWLLIDVESGVVVEGGQAAPARTLVQDTGSGRTTSQTINAHGSAPLPWDAQRTLELALKTFAVSAGLAALILSIVAVVTVFLS